MAITFEIAYDEVVVSEDIPALPAIWKKRIKDTIEERLTTNPEVYGKPLRRSLRGNRKLRVGNYRVTFRITGRLVFIWAISPRSIVYKKTEKRARLH